MKDLKDLEVDDEVVFVGPIDSGGTLDFFASGPQLWIGEITDFIANGDGKEGLYVKFNWCGKTVHGLISRRQVVDVIEKVRRVETEKS
jgi:hypothetical protein